MSMSAVQKRYAILDAMGISLWGQRLDSPWAISKLILCARCLVLLSHPTQQPKILQGMLKVLELKKNELVVAWPKYPLETKMVDAALVQWAPYSLLILGHLVTPSPLGIHIQMTYHPDELAQSPAYKPRAYADLLKLKKYLSM